MATKDDSTSWERITQQIDKEIRDTEFKLKYARQEASELETQLSELTALKEITVKTGSKEFREEKSFKKSRKIPSLPPKRSRRQKAKRGLMKSQVLRALKNAAGRLTPKEIYSVMNDNGFFSPAKNPIGAVRAQLGHLAKNGTVEKVMIQGRGVVFGIKHHESPSLPSRGEKTTSPLERKH